MENNLGSQPEPRFSMRYELPQQWLLKGAIGRYTQMPPIERYAQGIGNPDLNLMKEMASQRRWRRGVGLWSTTGHIIFAGYMDDLVIRDLEVDTYNSGEKNYIRITALLSWCYWNFLRLGNASSHQTQSIFLSGLGVFDHLQSLTSRFHRTTFSFGLRSASQSHGCWCL